MKPLSLILCTTLAAGAVQVRRKGIINIAGSEQVQLKMTVWLVIIREKKHA